MGRGDRGVDPRSALRARGKVGEAREGDRTPEFIEFADVVMVCDLCYLEIKKRHSSCLSE
jgi:hypothetical protein